LFFHSLKTSIQKGNLQNCMLENLNLQINEIDRRRKQQIDELEVIGGYTYGILLFLYEQFNTLAIVTGTATVAATLNEVRKLSKKVSKLQNSPSQSNSAQQQQPFIITKEAVDAIIHSVHDIFKNANPEQQHHARHRRSGSPSSSSTKIYEEPPSKSRLLEIEGPTTSASLQKYSTPFGPFNETKTKTNTSKKPLLEIQGNTILTNYRNKPSLGGRKRKTTKRKRGSMTLKRRKATKRSSRKY
jgi:hypothetical protein